MILTASDVDEFIAAYEKFWRPQKRRRDEWKSDDLLAWLNEHPQVVAASGYQEFVAGGESRLYQSLVRDGELDDLDRPLFRHFEGAWIIPSDIGLHPRESWGAFRLVDLLHISEIERELDERAPSLTRTEYDRRRDEIDALSIQAVTEMPSFNDMVEAANQLVDNPLVDPTVWVSPKLWTPTHQTHQKLYLERSAKVLIAELQANKLTLSDLHWREFEEVVAESLRSQGLEIHLVKENPQGGRDIIARAPLILGCEVMTIAIEVKHRPSVDKPVLQQALQQNRHFPALMLVTSGTFTAGVRTEARKPQNRMRIMLHDGVSVGAMLKAYQLCTRTVDSVST